MASARDVSESACGIVFGYNTLCDQEWIAVPVAVIAFGCILFSFYICLFGYSILILKQQKRTGWIAAMTLLFLLSASGFFISTVNVVFQSSQVQRIEKIPFPSDWQAMVSLRNVLVEEVRRQLRGTTIAGMLLLVITNLVAYVILLYRCYMVWGSRLRVVVVPGLFCVAATVFGIWNAVVLSRIRGVFPFTPILGSGGPLLSQFAIFIFVTLFSNLLLTMMIAGRLIYINRRASKYMELSVWKMYDHAITVTLESGLIYPTVLFIYTIIVGIDISNNNNFNWHPTKAFVTVHAVLHYSLIQFIGIAPTFIIVRFGLGITVGERSTGYEGVVPVQDPIPPSSLYSLDVEKYRSGSMESVDFETYGTIVYDVPVLTK